MSSFIPDKNFKVEIEFPLTERDTFIKKSSFFVFRLIFLAVKIANLIMTPSKFYEM